MARKGSLAGAYILSARFLAWARSNGLAPLIEDVEAARAAYDESGAKSSYAKYTGNELEAAHKKTQARLERIDEERKRRRTAAGANATA